MEFSRQPQRARYTWPHREMQEAVRTPRKSVDFRVMQYTYRAERCNGTYLCSWGLGEVVVVVVAADEQNQRYITTAAAAGGIGTSGGGVWRGGPVRPSRYETRSGRGQGRRSWRFSSHTRIQAVYETWREPKQHHGPSARSPSPHVERAGRRRGASMAERAHVGLARRVLLRFGGLALRGGGRGGLVGDEDVVAADVEEGVLRELDAALAVVVRVDQVDLSDGK